MGTRYNQLRLAERCEIFRLRAGGISLRRIALHLGRSPATISRELRRNAVRTKVWPGGYAPERAQGLAERRRRWDCRFKMARQPELREHVRQLLAMGWSPEQIAGRLARTDVSMRISHESIYRFIYHRVAQKDYWHRLLPNRKNRRGRLMRGGVSPLRSFKRRVSIDDRPPEVSDRRNKGHWEADLMCFTKRNEAVLVVHERTSRITRTARQTTKAAPVVADAIGRLIAPLPAELRRTMTFDNGTEFAQHYRLTDELGVETFFCDTHSPWQKGGVENAILRLRRALPRKSDLGAISARQLASIVANYNATPRRCLDFKTPAEVFWENLNTLHFNRETT
ncbi:IS30 family transposase, partial [Hyphomicrobium sulfonivorans]|uniref:IS30 family transposase n=1 Tax=Hyphomicrobium sulfonivorans TaxID=121290 RepID=UPI0018E0F330